MNKTAIRNFAVWARNKLIADIGYHASLFGITKDGISKALPQSTNDVEFYDIGTTEPFSIRGDEIRQRRSLANAIRTKEKNSNYETAYSSVIEEVAYTWFNRLIAIRFMEVNDYLPAQIRILSSESGKQEPDIVTTPFDADLYFDECEQQKIIQMKNDNQLDEVFRMLFIKQCRELSKILPRLFEGTTDYTELLLSLSFIDQDGVVYHLVHDIPEDDFNIEKGGQVEIIGWLYQYYNAELKDETFALLKNNVKVTKERIPSATQLFTPDWIVRYMVENSLGRLWVEGHPNEMLKSGWKYYLDEAEQDANVKEELKKIRDEYTKLNPEDIKVIDPCMGSGHILVYAFDVLMQIYESAGYTQRDAAKSILKNNLFGLDIDDRAAQLAYFAVMMKARQYNRRILDGETDCNVYAIKESNTFDREALVKLGDDLRPVAEKLLDVFVDAKEYGSIISVDLTLDELEALDKKLDEIDRMSEYGNLLDMMYADILCTELNALIRQSNVMVQKYDVVITNPPYMGSGNMCKDLLEFTKKNYPDTKSDLSTVFMEKSFEYLSDNGYMSMINIPVWMFLSSYEKLRQNLIDKTTIINMLHFGRGVFGADFGTTSFVFLSKRIHGYLAEYHKLYKKQGAVDTIEKKEKWFFEKYGIHHVMQEQFNKIPGSPIAYWLNHKIFDFYQDGETMESIAHPKVGMQTSNNDKYLRLWLEIDYSEFLGTSEKMIWIKYLKGGSFRKWYGNLEYLLHYNKTPSYILQQKNARVLDKEYLTKRKCTWTDLTSSSNSFRYAPEDTFYDISGHCFFPKEEDQYWLLGYANSSIFAELLKVFNSSIHCQVGDVARVVVPKIDNGIKNNISRIAKECVEYSKKDWDSFETSWDFKKHPLI